MKGTPTPDTREYRMELFLRSLAPPEARDVQAEIIDRLNRLDARDRIRASELTVWGDQVRLDVTPRTETERTVRDTVDRFRRWERTHEASLAPGFREHEIDPLDGDRFTVLRFPVITLGVYTETDVWGVFPCRMNGEVVTVSECLDAFRTHLPASEPGSVG